MGHRLLALMGGWGMDFPVLSPVGGGGLGAGGLRPEVRGSESKVST